MRFFSGTRLFLTGWVLLAAQVAFGQTVGSIAGETRDATGAGVPGASISLTNVATNAVRMVVTNEAGVYAFAAGTHRIEGDAGATPFVFWVGPPSLEPVRIGPGDLSRVFPIPGDF